MSLPPDSVATWNEGGLRCPWCAADCDAATVTLGALLYSHHAGALTHAPRKPDGTADVDALPSSCPECARPFIVALQDIGRGRALRLLAVRTEADARLTGGRP